ncbi:MAG: WhiB family transcriptional regulator [Acidimicrobiia bacterium]|nr:WhiB family transcriptional regulator [Acidimicrobiia bacterium]
MTTIDYNTQDDWFKRAACRGLSPSVFFPVPGNRRALAVARAICEGCQVQESCLLAGWEQTDGIFGGLTPMERRRLQATIAAEMIGAEG